MHQALGIPASKRGHRTAQNLKKKYAIFDECESIAIVRNPFDRMVSLYEFRKKKGAVGKKTFTQWVKSKLISNKNITMDFMNNMDCIYKGKYLVKHVLIYEHLDEDYERLNQEVYKGALPPLPNLMQRKKKIIEHIMMNLLRN